MKTSNMTRSRNQVYSVGNYLMTGKVLGKGHFARVEEATHRIIGKKVAIKIIDLTCIKEEYARRNLHREPRVMAKLRHPCIAALYETMMHGPRLYVAMEAAGGGDLCALVLGARGRGPGGLPEGRARPLAAQLVSAVRHMHARGVVHRDLKMENIMLDSSKQYIKIVDFGLSNVWSAGGALRTPCGSLEYAAPELFLDGRRYGPEVDLWSIGVIVYGMVTGGLPFTGADGPAGAEDKSRPLLRAAISRGFCRKQRVALACASTECKTFIQQLLEPKVEQRMKIEEASRHRWIKRPGMRMKIHPFGSIDPKVNREIYKQISELCGQSIIDVVAEIKADPFGPIAGIYNIKMHLHQAQTTPGTDLLWSTNTLEPRPITPPAYQAKELVQHLAETTASSSSKLSPLISTSPSKNIIYNGLPKFKPQAKQTDISNQLVQKSNTAINRISTVTTLSQVPISKFVKQDQIKLTKRNEPTSPRVSNSRPLSSSYGMKKPIYRVYDSGDCGFDPRLPSITEHSNIDLNDAKNGSRYTKSSCVRKVNLEQERLVRLNSCQSRTSDVKRTEFYRRAGDGLPSWSATGVVNTSSARILLQNNATTIKRASLGNIVSPHSSTNSQCKSERAMPVGWYSSKSSKDTPHMQRLRRTAPMK
ncbi:serine/threonine-protein kinase MARK2-like [Galleria mellonella]|uniref:Serine/threonine-protein kinase MARK2-like n=1 Tax=Galleria mellonella TaxID=7137 RepID=A0A6J1X2G0_GALME|nr:serine/threonine-protein kinase MARK2-like [Galleria mellonella]